MKFNLFGAILALVGQALIACCFLLILPAELLFNGPANMWLDFTVVSIIYWLWVGVLGFAPVRADDPTQSAIGGLGIKWSAIITYSILAGGFALTGMLMGANGTPLDFKWQILAQGIILFGLLLALLSSRSASQKTAQVFNDQQQKMAGKADIKFALQDVLTAAEDNNAVPREVVGRLKVLSSDARFITPDASPAAADADRRVLADCDALSAAFFDYAANSRYATELLSQLERDFRRRRAL